MADTRIHARYGSGRNRFSVAAGSPGELGLLKALAEAFVWRADAQVVWIKAGTGESLELMRDRHVDMAMVHAPNQVDAAIDEGWAVGKTLIGANEFYIVGPEFDPAGVSFAIDVTDAFRRIFATRSPFVSRGDRSGTHEKEMQIWTSAGIKPQGSWYIVAHDFMLASLARASAESAYFMCDSSTWIMEKDIAPKLTIMFRGDSCMVNAYHAIVAPAGATLGRDTAERFADFLASCDGQEIIRDYGRDRFGEGIYADAACAQTHIAQSIPRGKLR